MNHFVEREARGGRNFTVFSFTVFLVGCGIIVLEEGTDKQMSHSETISLHHKDLRKVSRAQIQVDTGVDL